MGSNSENATQILSSILSTARDFYQREIESHIHQKKELDGSIAQLVAWLDEIDRHAAEELQEIDRYNTTTLVEVKRLVRHHEYKFLSPTPSFTFTYRAKVPIRDWYTGSMPPGSSWKREPPSRAVLERQKVFHFEGKMKNKRTSSAFAAVVLQGWLREVEADRIAAHRRRLEDLKRRRERTSKEHESALYEGQFLAEALQKCYQRLQTVDRDLEPIGQCPTEVVKALKTNNAYAIAVALSLKTAFPRVEDCGAAVVPDLCRKVSDPRGHEYFANRLALDKEKCVYNQRLSRLVSLGQCRGASRASFQTQVRQNRERAARALPLAIEDETVNEDNGPDSDDEAGRQRYDDVREKMKTWNQNLRDPLDFLRETLGSDGKNQSPQWAELSSAREVVQESLLEAERDLVVSERIETSLLRANEDSVAVYGCFAGSKSASQGWQSVYEGVAWEGLPV